MTRPIITIHNIETDEIIEREMNDKEFKQFEKDQLKAEAEARKIEAEAEARNSILNRLGITEDEAKLLLS